MSGRPGPRALALVCAGLAVSAGLFWVASATVWYRVRPAQAEPVELTGGQVSPWLGGVALLALAGVAGVVAAGGPLRRLVGGLLALAGAGVLVSGVRALWADPVATGAAAASGPASPHGPGGAGPVAGPGADLHALREAPTDMTGAPLWAVVGALVLLAVGVVVALREPRLPRLGARYAAAGERRSDPDPDRSAWQELDEGRDPTIDPGERPLGDAGDDPDDGPRNAAV